MQKPIAYLLKLIWVSFTILCYFTVFSIAKEKITTMEINNIGWPFYINKQFYLRDGVHHSFHFENLFLNALIATGIAIAYLYLKTKLKK